MLSKDEIYTIKFDDRVKKTLEKEMKYRVDHVYTLHRIAGNELDTILEDNIS